MANGDTTRVDGVKIVMLKGEKGDTGYPTDEQVSEALETLGKPWIDDWLDDGNGEDAIGDWLTAHPEATTTVTDGSITYAKLHNSLKTFVTPEMFGAVGDGVTDDTSAIQSAFDSGKSIVFANAYACGTVNVNDIDGAIYVGCKNATFLGEVAITFTECKNLTFDSLLFDSCTHNNFAVKLVDCENIAFKQCKFKDMPYSAIQITRSTADAISKRYLFDGCTFVDVNTSETWGGGIYWDGLGSNGVDGLTAKQISDVTVTNCHFENVGCVAVNSGGCIGLSVCNNICDQNNADYTATMGLITTSRESKRIVANNNIVLHTKFEGMIFNRSSDIVANGNYFFDCKNSIAVENASSDILCVGNIIVGGYTEGSINTNNESCFGILIKESTNIKIDGNSIRDCYSGVYIIDGTQNAMISNCEIKSVNTCITSQQPTTDKQTKDIKVCNNVLVSDIGHSIVCILYSGEYVIIGNTLKNSANSAIRIYNSGLINESRFVIENNKVISSNSAVDLTNFSSNITSGDMRFIIVENDFSECASCIKKDALARILPISFARNKKIMTAGEMFGYFDSNSVMKYDGTLATLLAETPGSQNMQYVRWQIGSVVECTDKFIHVTRAGNPSSGATLQYKEW